MSLSSLLNDQVTLRRSTQSTDESLGSPLSWTDLLTTSASIQPLTAKERWEFMQRGVQMTHRIYFDYDIGATRMDRIYVPSTGKSFNVLAFYDQAGRHRVWAVDALEMT